MADKGFTLNDRDARDFGDMRKALKTIGVGGNHTPHSIQRALPLDTIKVQVVSIVSGQGGRYNGYLVGDGVNDAPSGNLAGSDLGSVGSADGVELWCLDEIGTSNHNVPVDGTVYVVEQIIGCRADNKKPVVCFRWQYWHLFHKGGSGVETDDGPVGELHLDFDNHVGEIYWENTHTGLTHHLKGLTWSMTVSGVTGSGATVAPIPKVTHLKFTGSGTGSGIYIHAHGTSGDWDGNYVEFKCGASGGGSGSFTVPGSNHDVIYNLAGALGADNNFQWDKDLSQLKIDGSATAFVLGGASTTYSQVDIYGSTCAFNIGKLWNSDTYSLSTTLNLWGGSGSSVLNIIGQTATLNFYPPGGSQVAAIRAADFLAVSAANQLNLSSDAGSSKVWLGSGIEISSSPFVSIYSDYTINLNAGVYGYATLMMDSSGSINLAVGNLNNINLNFDEALITHVYKVSLTVGSAGDPKFTMLSGLHSVNLWPIQEGSTGLSQGDIYWMRSGSLFGGSISAGFGVLCIVT